MQYRSLARWALATVVGAVAAVTACSSDSSPTDVVTQQQQQTTKSGGDSSTGGGSGGGSGPSTSSGAVASVVVSPHSVSIAQGSYAVLVAEAYDSKGLRVNVDLRKVSWRSSNTGVVSTPGDTGSIRGVSQGTAKIYATLEGHTDSAVVVVGPPQSSPPPSPTPDSVHAVAQFDLTAIVYGRLPGADTSKTEIVAGATIKLRRTTDANGNTLTMPVDAGSAVTDATGTASFHALSGGAYLFEITPPGGSPYQAVSGGLGFATLPNMHLSFVLPRKP